MASVKISKQAYVKLVLHSLAHPHNAVNGVLLGTATGSGLQIEDAIPLFHTQLALAPMLEIAMGQARLFYKTIQIKFMLYLSTALRGAGGRARGDGGAGDCGVLPRKRAGGRHRAGAGGAQNRGQNPVAGALRMRAAGAPPSPAAAPALPPPQRCRGSRRPPGEAAPRPRTPVRRLTPRSFAARPATRRKSLSRRFSPDPSPPSPPRACACACASTRPQPGTAAV